MALSTSKCRGCLNKVNSCCSECGNFTRVAQRRTITSLLRTAHFHYFNCTIGDQDKSCAPHICCKPCYNGLTAWFNGKKAAFNFAVPMVRREPRNHADDCYFCLTNITGFNASSRKKFKYPNLRSAMRSVPHSDDLPVPTSPVNKDLLSSSNEEMPSREDSAESIYLEVIESTYCSWRTQPQRESSGGHEQGASSSSSHQAWFYEDFREGVAQKRCCLLTFVYFVPRS